MTKPWEQQTKESAKAYEAAKLYFELGSDRSIDAVHKQIGKSSRFLAKWSSEHKWVERAKAFDMHQEKIRRAAAEKALVEETKKWEKRRIKIKDDAWINAELLKQKAREMLAYHLDDTRWTLKDASSFLEVAEKLARLAAEMATEHKLVTVDIKQQAQDTFEELLAEYKDVPKEIIAAKVAAQFEIDPNELLTESEAIN